MDGLPNELYLQCRNILLNCSEFDSDDVLKDVFATVEELRPFRDALPDSTKNKRDRVDKYLSFLLEKRLNDGRSVFLVFLKLLAERQPKEDILRNHLYKLFEELQSVIISKYQSEEAQESRDLNTIFQDYKQSINPKEVERWFEECESDIVESTFRITLAVFNGTLYLDILKAAKNLEERFTQVKGSTEKIELTFQSPFSKSKNFLERAGAKLEMVDTEYGRSQVAILDKPSYSPSLLTCLWIKYNNPEIHKNIIDWLREYAIDKKVAMRNRAAAAMGILAQVDFANIQDSVLLPWAKNNDRVCRAAK